VTFVLLAALAATPCDAAAVQSLSEERQGPACELLAQQPAARAMTVPLDSIFERPGFENARRRNTGALRAFLARLRAMLEAIFESSGAEAYSNVTRFLVLLVGALVVVFAGLRLLGRRKKAAAAASSGSRSTALKLDDPATHLSRARTLLTDQPREAIREALMSLLSHLERQRLARPDRVKTNAELAGELPARGAPPELVASVTALLRWYDGAFYSLEPVPPEAAARFLDDVASTGARVEAGGAA